MRIRNYSERTIAVYRSLLVELLRSIEKDPLSIQTEDVKNYIYMRLKRDHISVSTINQTLSAWKLFYVHILGKDWEQCRIARPRRNKALPVVLSQLEARLLINAPRNIKHKAILYLMYSTGMRRQELLSMKLLDIDSSRMVVNIRQGKGSKDRQAILHPKVLELLRAYYSGYRPRHYLFEGQGEKQEYSASSLSKIIKRNALKAGISKTVSPHTLRHCFATHMLERGANLKIIQQLMGHSSLKTTSIYLSLANIEISSLPNPLDDERK